jgi:ABC-type multidrug transport system ATPase subunit
MNADRIVVVDDGKFVEQGTHESLLAAKGKYADLWSKQTFLKPKKTQKEQCNGDTTLAPGEADHKSHLESVENPTENGTQAARQQQAEHSTGQESIELTRFLNS